jgi:hypothetical protein
MAMMTSRDCRDIKVIVGGMVGDVPRGLRIVRRT